MCRWGCGTTDTTFMCRWCGTRYCSDCLRGEFTGHASTGKLMKESTTCAECKQAMCQGERVEYVPRLDDDKKRKGKGGKKSGKKGKLGKKKKSGKKKKKKRK